MSNTGSIPGVDVWQIGSEAGFLETPVNLTAGHHNQALLAPAERADLIIDFTRCRRKASPFRAGI
jgi:hypothetical protein